MYDKIHYKLKKKNTSKEKKKIKMLVCDRQKKKTKKMEKL